MTSYAVLIVIFFTTAHCEEKSEVIASESVFLDGLRVVEFVPKKELKLSWLLNVPETRQYVLEIYYSAMKIAAGNSSSFTLTQFAHRTFANISTRINRTAVSLTFDSTAAAKVFNKPSPYYVFMVVLRLDNDREHHKVFTHIQVKYICGYYCTRKAFSLDIILGVCFSMLAVIAAFTLWIIREKVAKVLGCKYCLEEPYKPSPFIMPTVSVMVPDYNQVFAKKQPAKLVGKCDIDLSDNPFATVSAVSEIKHENKEKEEEDDKQEKRETQEKVENKETTEIQEKDNNESTICEKKDQNKLTDYSAKSEHNEKICDEDTVASCNEKQDQNEQHENSNATDENDISIDIPVIFDEIEERMELMNTEKINQSDEKKEKINQSDEKKETSKQNQKVVRFSESVMSDNGNLSGDGKLYTIIHIENGQSKV